MAGITVTQVVGISMLTSALTGIAGSVAYGMLSQVPFAAFYVLAGSVAAGIWITIAGTPRDDGSAPGTGPDASTQSHP